MILITGATGCVGRHVADALIRTGEPVRVLAESAEDWRRNNDALEVAPDQVHIGDIRDRAAVDRAVAGCRAVVNIAGVAGISTRRRGLMHAVNTAGARNVADAALGHRTRLVHTSSASTVWLSEACDGPDRVTPTSTAPSRHPYPSTKRMGELIVLRRVDRGLDAVILNPGAVLASGGDPRTTWSGLVPQIARHRVIPVPPGGFGFVGRDQVVAAHLAALSRGEAGIRYLVVGENLTYRALFAKVAHALGVRRHWLPVSRPALRIAAAALGPARAVTPARWDPLVVRENLPLLVEFPRFRGDRTALDLGVPSRRVDPAIADMVAAHRARPAAGAPWPPHRKGTRSA